MNLASWAQEAKARGLRVRQRLLGLVSEDKDHFRLAGLHRVDAHSGAVDEDLARQARPLDGAVPEGGPFVPVGTVAHGREVFEDAGEDGPQMQGSDGPSPRPAHVGCSHARARGPREIAVRAGSDRQPPVVRGQRKALHAAHVHLRENGA